MIYHSARSATEQARRVSPEGMKRIMDSWTAWAERCGSALVDPGAPLMGGQKLTKSGSSASDKNVIGYSILQAEDMEGAKALLEGHPYFEDPADDEIEVHESMPLPT